MINITVPAACGLEMTRGGQNFMIPGNPDRQHCWIPQRKVHRLVYLRRSYTCNTFKTLKSEAFILNRR